MAMDWDDGKGQEGEKSPNERALREQVLGLEIEKSLGIGISQSEVNRNG